MKKRVLTLAFVLAAIAGGTALIYATQRSNQASADPGNPVVHPNEPGCSDPKTCGDPRRLTLDAGVPSDAQR